MLNKYFFIKLLFVISIFLSFSTHTFAGSQKGKKLKGKVHKIAKFIPVVESVAKKRYEREKGIVRMYGEGLIKQIDNDLKNKVKKDISSDEEKKVNLSIADIRVQAEIERFLKKHDENGAKRYLVSLGISQERVDDELKKRKDEYDKNQKKEEELKNLKEGFVAKLKSWFKFWTKEDESKLPPSLARYAAKKKLEDGLKVFGKVFKTEGTMAKEFDDVLNVAVYKKILEETKSKYKSESIEENADAILKEAKKTFMDKIVNENGSIKDAEKGELEGYINNLAARVGLFGALNEEMKKKKSRTKKELLIEDIFGSPGKFLTPEQRRIVEEESFSTIKLKTGLLPKMAKRTKLGAQAAISTGKFAGKKGLKPVIKKTWKGAVE